MFIAVVDTKMLQKVAFFQNTQLDSSVHQTEKLSQHQCFELFSSQ